MQADEHSAVAACSVGTDLHGCVGVCRSVVCCLPKCLVGAERQRLGIAQQGGRYEAVYKQGLMLLTDGCSEGFFTR